MRSGLPGLELGGGYVDRSRGCPGGAGAAAPLTTKGTKFPFAVSLVPTLKRYPVGALIGMVITGIVSLLTGVLPDRIWLEIPLTLICVPGCMVIERLLDWRFSGTVDARMRHSAASEDAKLAMDKLEDYQNRGFISKPDAHRLGGIIARRDVSAAPRQPKPRGQSKRQSNHAAPPPTPRATSATEPQKPAA